ncbi:ribose 5-phosphate isomerase B [Breznakia sp. PF5-3]|uniref:ribose 5-phosphate isomerase B n=1 Tax=unclassified Breznakia TaxID=2623764 RepID=UPI00240525AA|nr:MULTISPECIES: ribose 5-phosphate isomerase B [unclassified Breznakia]MDL2276893.1 ribose 5-phosphate isomerase B [Breznakia sp. OttesenSCG-928-G09]MDF9825834.1 ribose 5-phosphate isomerase B [Breznakia sp. PM6-1]MDF9836639.1 ribose 5-phosphate isomerase B [Breznakia sp. PF5-3]MDF9838886.1 ribose 5-phosphate isomerase B [Breznakia sp. PFB2-8]MDF9860912.1 ribose 5-phosphate isomerase B [Breznakia sp. PH5-24]
MKVAVACDHGAYEYKEKVIEILKSLEHEVEDFGCYDKQSVDYPDMVYPAAKSVADGKNDCGIVLCGTGIGASITANKVKGIRCSLVSDLFTAKVTREHNDSNVLALGQRVLGESIMEEIVRTWLATPFSEDQRHKNRIEKIKSIEEKEE